MARIYPDEYMVAYDDELGIVYAPKKGVIKQTTPQHASAIEKGLLQYIDRRMEPQDMRELENYMERAFADTENLPIMPPATLRERKVLNRLEIVIANDCNLRCRYCYAHSGTYGMKIQRMSPEMARQYLTRLLVKQYSLVNVVTFFGGEPMLRPDTIQAVCDFFHENVEKGVFEHLPTFLMVSNGTLIDKHIVELIHRYNIRVTISIDGPREINDLLRVDAEGKGVFDRISRGIKLLEDAGIPPIMLEATYTEKHNAMGYTKEDIQDFLKKKFHVRNVVVADCCGDTDQSLAYIDKDAHIENNEEKLYCDINYTKLCLKQRAISDIGCDVCYGAITLLPNGELYPCHFFVNHKEYKIAEYVKGDFDFSNYENVLSKFKAIQKSKNPKCSNCWAKPVCHSCPAQQLIENDDEGIEASCRTRKEIQKILILKCAKLSVSKS